MLGGLWAVVEAATGVDRKLIKDGIKTAAVNYVQANTCKCGCLKWAHDKDGVCSRCNCPRFEGKT
jgi:hypothetical protein